jgi:anti-anti-sigma factor
MSGHLEVEVSRMAVVTIRGEIDMDGLDALQGAVEAHLAPGQAVVFDLSAVTFADSTLLHVLDFVRSKATELGGDVLVRNPTPQVRQLLSMADLDDLVQAEVDRQNDLR